MAQRQTILITAALTAFLVAAPARAVIHLSFGLYTSNKPTTMVKQFRPVLDLVEERTSEHLGTPVEIRIQVAKDYEQGIAHLASGKVDFSRFGPASYIEAKRANSGLRILAMERVRGDKVFYGIIAVGKESLIASVEELRGASFAFGNDQSTIGRYLSQLFLRNHGIISTDLSRFEYLGRHDTVGTAVGAGHFDAGALNEATFSKLVAKGVPIRELARFPNVTKPWIAREGLPERLYAALREALLEIEDPVVVKLLKADGFVTGDDADFADIRAAIEMNSKFFEPSPSSVQGATASLDEEGSVGLSGEATPPMVGNASADEDTDRAAPSGAMDTAAADANAEVRPASVSPMVAVPGGTSVPSIVDRSANDEVPDVEAMPVASEPAKAALTPEPGGASPSSSSAAIGDATPVADAVPTTVSADKPVLADRDETMFTDHPGRAPSVPVSNDAAGDVSQSIERSAAVTASFSQSGVSKNVP